MMNERSTPKGLIFTILLAAVIIAGAFILMSLQYQNTIQQLQVQLTEQKGGGLNLDQKIEEGILKFIEKQKQLAQGRSRGQAGKVRPVSKSRDHIRGNPDAEISLIEYSDFECPFCKKFHPTAKKLIELYPDKVNWVYRHFPLGFHNPLAQKEAEASECANELGGNDKFWEYTDLIYERTKSNGNGLPLAQLAPMAEEIGLNGEKFQTCLDSGKYAERVQEDFREGTSIGITGTPGNILLNNRTGQSVLKAGAYPVEAFVSEINRLMQ